MANIDINIFKAEKFFSYEEIIRNIKEKLFRKTTDVGEWNGEVAIGHNVFKLCALYGHTTNSIDDKTWEKGFKENFGLESSTEKNSNSCYGYIIINNSKNRYILTFGRGNSNITELIDYEFGLIMASKMLNEYKLKLQSSKFYGLDKNKSITEFSLAQFRGTIGESVDALIGEVVEYPGRHCIENLQDIIGKEVKFTTSVFVDVKSENFDIENICKIILNIEEIYNIYGERVSIPRLIRVKEREIELLTELNNKVNEKIASRDFEDGKMWISFYEVKNSQIYFRDNIDGYKIMEGRKILDELDSISLDNISNILEDNNIQDINKINVVVTDSAGNNYKCKIYDLLEYTLNLEDPNIYYTLSSGVWYKYNKVYMDTINHELEKIKSITQFDERYDYITEDIERYSSQHIEELKRIVDPPYPELKYNYKYAKENDGVLCDRNTSSGIEVCDVYTEYNGLTHVKIGQPSDFITCINQSIDGLTEYTGNKVAVQDSLNIGDTNKVTLLLITKNRSVISSEDITKFDSLKFKIRLIEWEKFVSGHQYNAKIIIAKKV
ncbi:MAG: TIGR04141 family sporadically distributed protein [Clostridia bacterium]|nr:TIGR04141 family sporadically distributed protein [Clostridia bacterium]